MFHSSYEEAGVATGSRNPFSLLDKRSHKTKREAYNGETGQYRVVVAVVAAVELFGGV